MGKENLQTARSTFKTNEHLPRQKAGKHTVLS